MQRIIKKSPPENGSSGGGIVYKMLILSFTLQEYVLKDEQYAQNIHQRIDFLALAADQVDYNIGDYAEGNTF